MKVFLLRPDNFLPIVLTLPSTSVRPFQRYLIRLASSQCPHFSVVTRLELERVKNASGIPFSKVLPSRLEKLSAVDAEKMRAYASAIRAALGASQDTEEVEWQAEG